LTLATVPAEKFDKAEYNFHVLCPKAGPYTCDPGTGHETFRMFWMEMWGTCGFVGFIISAACYTKCSDTIYVPYAIGLSLMVFIVWIGGITGGCLNPAAGLAICVM